LQPECNLGKNAIVVAIRIKWLMKARDDSPLGVFPLAHQKVVHLPAEWNATSILPALAAI
jgi:hypothetical protein